jgi:hypothetical protein
MVPSGIAECQTVLVKSTLTLVKIIFKNSVRTSKRTQLATVTNINLLSLFKEVIAVYTENQVELLNTKYGVSDS